MKKLSILIAFITIASAASTYAQTESVWKTLAKITYRKEYDELMGFKIDKPVFSDAIKNMEGKTITVKGYIIPVEGYKSHKEFIFSAFPYSMCFFCGGAGPETVMEVSAKEAIKYTTEQITLTGTLRLNSDDINRLMFKIDHAVRVDK
ncbi:MAG: hypothetical protein IPH94_03880 [Saprospiraceae bacterium]|nr:hypothetical protein [Saprospiraceae bacterium]MBK7220498.1 hypothetical protein [Saprospiraceae bacterium]MBK9687435.1 hypothetical protein [Saprospiraceae bacterium]MBL0084152.1 hypothetical protein [Saprospiraceae bacterium]HMT00349.1 hypothetical protein [Saprospiraceae bacterium]